MLLSKIARTQQQLKRRKWLRESTGEQRGRMGELRGSRWTKMSFSREAKRRGLSQRRSRIGLRSGSLYIYPELGIGDPELRTGDYRSKSGEGAEPLYREQRENTKKHRKSTREHSREHWGVANKQMKTQQKRKNSGFLKSLIWLHSIRLQLFLLFTPQYCLTQPAAV